MPDTVAEHPLPVHAESFVFRDEMNAPFYRLQLGNENLSNIAIFFISGSGCASVKHRLGSYFEPIRDKINATVFALQKRAIDEENRTGRACSAAFHKTDYIEQTVADQREFIDAQLARFSVKPKAVVLLGASEGAFVAARIANVDRRITHLGLIGGGGATMRENLKVLSRSTWYLRNPDKRFAEIAAEPDNTDAKIWGHSHKYWASLLDIDIGNELIKLDIPIVAAMGEKDESVSVDAARRMQVAFSGAGKKNLALLIYPNANHRLEDREHKKFYAGDFLERLVATIQETVTVEHHRMLTPGET
ncbi:MAG: alpha/beta hydrolase, partial [Azoarcus sp.]|nr:alpha/beta hydrolase [Azoarcus sp.]